MNNKKEEKWYIELLRVIIIGVVTGIIGPLLMKSLYMSIVYIQNRLNFFLIFTPLIGFSIVYLIWKISPSVFGSGRDFYIIHAVTPFIRLKTLIAKYLSTLITLSFGGSGGLVSPSLLMGAGLSSIFKMKREGRINPKIAASASLLTAYLGLPLTSAIISSELLEEEGVSYNNLLASFISSALSFSIVKEFFGGGIINLFEYKIMSHYTFSNIILAIPIAVGISYFSILFVKTYRAFLKFLDEKFGMNIKRYLFGASMVVIINLFFGINTAKFLSASVIMGFGTIDLIKFITGKFIATSFTIGTGASAGFVAPSILIGFAFGKLIHLIFGIPLSVSLPISTTSMLAGVINVPLAGVIMAMETFGEVTIIPALLGSAISYIVSRKYVAV